MNTPQSDIKIEDADGNCTPMTDYEVGRIMTEVFFGGAETVFISFLHIC